MGGDEIIDAEWEDVPGNTGTLQVRVEPRQKDERATQDAAAMPERGALATLLEMYHSAVDALSEWIYWLVKASIVLGVGILVGLWLVRLLHEHPATPPGVANEAQSTEVSSSVEQMLSDWTEFVTGEAGTDGFAIVDGSGKPGEFCNSATGTTLMTFANQKLLGAPIADYFSLIPSQGNSGTVGAFEFDAETEELHAVRLAKINLKTKDVAPVADITMTASRVAPNIVDIDGTRYHVCIL